MHKSVESIVFENIVKHFSNIIYNGLYNITMFYFLVNFSVNNV